MKGKLTLLVAVTVSIFGKLQFFVHVLTSACYSKTVILLAGVLHAEVS